MSLTPVVEKLLWMAGRVLLLIPSECVMTILTGVNRGFLWVRGAANAPEWIGIYEASKQRMLESLVQPGEVAFDVGANAGFYSLALSRLVGPRGQVFAFEPFPKNINKLLRHLELNSIQNVVLVDKAVAEKEGVTSFAAGESDFTGHLAGSGESGGSLEVAMVSLDAFVKERDMGDPDLLKIDVEGAEGLVLQGAAGILRRSHPKILLALHGTQAREDCFRLLHEHGYVIQDFQGQAVVSAESMPNEVVALSADLSR